MPDPLRLTSDDYLYDPDLDRYFDVRHFIIDYVERHAEAVAEAIQVAGQFDVSQLPELTRLVRSVLMGWETNDPGIVT
jgi:hypothetical protein